MLGLELGVGLHQIHRALARLEATDEQDVYLPVVVLRERLRAGVEVDVDAIWDDPVVTGEVARYEVSRSARHGDARIQLVQVAVADDAAGPVGEREAAEGVKGRDVGAPRRIEDLHREKRDERLVVVDDVEPLALEHVSNEPLEPKRERDSADRAVVRHRDRLALLDKGLGRRIAAPGRRDDPDTVSQTSGL